MSTSNNSKIYTLGVEVELRFIVDEHKLTLELLEGYAEIVGAEVLTNKVYTFPPFASISLFTWQGCKVMLRGQTKSVNVLDSLIMIQVHLHSILQQLRNFAEFENTVGPVSLIAGPKGVGKSSFAYFLLNYAARMNKNPIFVDLDVSKSALSMPGSICVLPVEKQSDITDGFEKKSLSIYSFGHKNPGYNIDLYFLLIKKLGEMLKSKVRASDSNTRSSGIIIDTCGWVQGFGYTAIYLAAKAFDIDQLFVLDDKTLYLKLLKDMPDKVKVLYVPKQRGVAEEHISQPINQQNPIWNYWYGHKRDIMPFTLEVSFSDLSIYRVEQPSTNVIDPRNINTTDINVSAVSFEPHLEQCFIGLSAADVIDDNLIVTPIKFYICVTNVDVNKKIITVLSPQCGPLPSKIGILGKLKFRKRNLI